MISAKGWDDLRCCSGSEAEQTRCYLSMRILSKVQIESSNVCLRNAGGFLQKKLQSTSLMMSCLE